jgi:hypothetical protein
LPAQAGRESQGEGCRNSQCPHVVHSEVSRNETPRGRSRFPPRSTRTDRLARRRAGCRPVPCR